MSIQPVASMTRRATSMIAHQRRNFATSAGNSKRTPNFQVAKGDTTPMTPTQIDAFLRHQQTRAESLDDERQELRQLELELQQLKAQQVASNQSPLMEFLRRHRWKIGVAVSALLALITSTQDAMLQHQHGLRCKEALRPVAKLYQSAKRDEETLERHCNSIQTLCEPAPEKTLRHTKEASAPALNDQSLEAAFASAVRDYVLQGSSNETSISHEEEQQRRKHQNAFSRLHARYNDVESGYKLLTK